MLQKLRRSLFDLQQFIALVSLDASPYVRRRLVFIIVLVIVAAALTALGPVALRYLVDALTGELQAATAAMYGLVALYVTSQWLSRSAGEIRSLVYAKVERRMFTLLSERVFGHLIRLPMRFHANRRTGEIVQTLENGLQGYQIILHHLVFTVLPVIAELGTIVIVLSRLGDPAFLGLFCAALVCYGSAFLYAAVSVIGPAEAAAAAAVDSTAAMVDPLLAVQTVKHFNAEPIVEGRVSGFLVQRERKSVTFAERYAYNGLGAAAIFMFFLGLTVAYAFHEVRHARMSVGEFVLINAYMLQILRPIEMIGYAMQGFSQGGGMLKKLRELLAETPEDYGFDDGQILSGAGRVEFDQVTAFHSPTQMALTDICFSVEPGKTLGIVGPSGSGKSSIIGVLTGMLEIASGSIRIDAICAKKISLRKLRRSISVVTQEPSLFDDTIANNIRLARPDASQAEVERAARVAHAHDFILALPEGYETRVGELGGKLSGGERQRIALARAFLKNPRIIALDEPTSALDAKSEQAVLQGAIDVSRGRTTLIVSHRLSAVVRADEIIVLDQGRIVQRGTHRKLLSVPGPYADLWELQHPGQARATNGGQATACFAT